ncbi:salivary glue protein Sgs-3-like isoform X2 [Pecten maximus]|uniref:salivary glue protein Sgs-3-like isoform X2 n=1 Tax=Pecten maximus TaxID=6579 RepID=UPI0014581042|nr:salivary glue protein Sgs-3-like isoform X2 [Pecten maximus]
MMISGITTVFFTFAVVSEGHQRRFLFGPEGGTSLESALPEECVYLSEFEDVLAIANGWIKTGEYLYSELLRIRIRELEYVTLDNIENGYRYLLQQWKGNRSTEFHEAIVSIEYTNQYRHTICLRMLEYLLNTFLKQHQGNVCAQYLRLPSKERGPNPVKCSPVQTALTTTAVPTSTTVAPTSTTVAPTSTTKAPTSTTVAPTSTTEAPTTAAPTSTTVAPTSTTVAPTSTTAAPTSTTVAPTSTTASTPTTPTKTTSARQPTTTAKPKTSPQTTKPIPRTTAQPTTATTTPVPTTIASTRTTQQTTSPTTINPNLSCAVCNNGDCKYNDTDLLSCPHPDQYCLVRINDKPDSRTVVRRCVDKAFCEQDYRTNGGYKSFCFMADDGAFGFSYECNFCCITNACNLGPNLIPIQNTLYQGN